MKQTLDPFSNRHTRTTYRWLSHFWLEMHEKYIQHLNFEIHIHIWWSFEMVQSYRLVFVVINVEKFNYSKQNKKEKEAHQNSKNMENLLLSKYYDSIIHNNPFIK